jgi:DNA-binding NarL/FixJ family response regulator
MARAVERGAAGAISKDLHLHDVVPAVRQVRSGDGMIGLSDMVELLRLAGDERRREAEHRRLSQALTRREREVLELLAAGLDRRQIAERLQIAPRTQRNHVARILTKLGVHSQFQALVFALRHDLIELPRRAPR